MRKLLTLLFSFFAIHSFAQIPVQRTTTTTPIDNYLKVKNLLTLPNLGDTITFSGSNGLDSLGSEIYVKSGANKGLWLRDTLNGSHVWVKQQYTGASIISKYNDSTLLICNSSSCDTIVVSVAAQPIQNWTVISDTSIQVCGINACDTVYTNPIYYGQTYVDSVTVGVGNTAVKDTVNWYKDGIKHQAGLLGKEIQTGQPLYVQYNSDSSTATIRILQADGIISGGIVTWSGSGLTYYVSPCVYQIGGVVYQSPQATITLAAADPTYARQDVFIVDTTGTASYLEGTPSASPTVPQTDAYQLALTTGITLNAGDTIPSSVTFNGIVYDEGLGTSGSELNTTSSGTITYDTLDVSNPFHLTKDLFVSSYNSNAALFFTGASQLVYRNSDVFSFHIYTNGNFKNKLSVAFVDNGTRVTDYVQVSSRYGFNANNGNTYQVINMPLLSFHWYNAGTYDGIEFFLQGNDNTGTNGFFLDYLFLQTGTTNTPPATDYSNKVDSSGTYKINDSTYVTKYWVKGISYVIGDTIHIISSGGGGGGSVNSVTGNPSGLVDNTDPTNPVVQQDALKLNISDTASMLSHYLNDVGYGLTKSGQIVILDSSKYATASVSGLLQNTDWIKFTNKTDSVSLNAGGDSLIVVKNNDRYAYKLPTGTTVTTQTVTSGSTVTINNSTTWLVINPASTLSSLTITMPASPTDGQLIDISFGGTISTTGAAVITSLLVVANTGQGLIGTGTYGQVVTEDHLAYRYNSSLSKWYRN